MKIDKDHAVAEALALLDEIGLDALSTRKLAERLGVKQPSLYWHFRDKQALLDAMNAQMMRTSHARRTPLAGEDWRDFLHAHATSFRACLLGRRDGARVHAGARAEPDALPEAEAHLACLVAAGFDVGAALTALVTVARFVVGFVLEEQAEAAHPPRLEAIEAFPLLSEAGRIYATLPREALFLSGLQAILRGLR
ncbi:TetR/AcrR family transcriptional regulator C-terminal domain-containing protein [Cypionkella sinensis]|uniref:TetR/AcrR family transcriptional regulator C-terminal domain-containing protein n=1 Tax=Cypionkella sinensis TaxID=1756043 RepID=A0ABV7J4L9_9RHOB